MADITMCSGKGCRVKDKCYRFTAKRCEYGQSYFFNPPLKVKNDILVCDYFWGEESDRIYKSIEDIFNDK